MSDLTIRVERVICENYVRYEDFDKAIDAGRGVLTSLLELSPNVATVNTVARVRSELSSNFGVSF